MRSCPNSGCSTGTCPTSRSQPSPKTTPTTSGSWPSEPNTQVLHDQHRAGRRNAMDNAPPLSIAISLGPDRARIFLQGELDLSTVDTLRTRFEEGIATNGEDR